MEGFDEWLKGKTGRNIDPLTECQFFHCDQINVMDKVLPSRRCISLVSVIDDPRPILLVVAWDG